MTTFKCLQLCFKALWLIQNQQHSADYKETNKLIYDQLS